MATPPPKVLAQATLGGEGIANLKIKKKMGLLDSQKWFFGNYKKCNSGVPTGYTPYTPYTLNFFWKFMGIPHSVVSSSDLQRKINSYCFCRGGLCYDRVQGEKFPG